MRRTRTALLILLTFVVSAAQPASGQLRAGVSSVDVTPPLGGPMYGYGARGESVSQGVHDRLFAKALVLDDGKTRWALVTLDLGSIRKENTRRVRSLVADAVGFDAVVLVASHTHSAPTFIDDFPSAQEPWLRTLEEQIAQSVIEAARALQPAAVAVGWGSASEGHNRRRIRSDGTVEMLWGNRQRVATSPIDDRVGVLAVDRADGGALATVVNYAVHPVILGPENLQISADYPGAMMSLVEREIGGQAMFLQGAAGDINPFWDKTSLADGAFERARRAGERLGLEVVRVRSALTGWQRDLELKISREEIELDSRWDLDSDRVAASFRKYGLESALERYRSRFANERMAEINTVLLGSEIALASFPGEFFVEHQLELRRRSPIPNVFFAGYANGELGYFPTIRAAAEGGYGAQEATLVEVGAGETLVNRALIRLLYLAGHLDAVPQF